VVAVRYVREHNRWIRFADDVAGEVDLSNGLRGEMFEPLRDPARFAEVSIEYNTLAWPDGADWAPETLYERVRAENGRASRSIGNAPEQESAYVVGMPEISRFFGIVVRMLANEHAPSHFRATYGAYEISVTIGDGVVTGRFPARALRLVLE
jgi:hypothetical protein